MILNSDTSLVNTLPKLLFFSIVLLILAVALFRLIDVFYMKITKRPLYLHWYLRLKQLTQKERLFLEEQFLFYRKLKPQNKKYFEHRLIHFMHDKEFIGRDGVFIDIEKKLLISATAVMLTFGMRDYCIRILKRIIVYPDVFYSTTNQEYHKGEFNPRLGALVLSWKDFEKGYLIEDDNLNLGIHEFTHAIHLDSLKKTTQWALTFSSGIQELLYLLEDKNIRERMVSSTYFRTYAYTNQFEFLAVVLENFIESPEHFKGAFPELYYKLRDMFNFRFAGY